MRMAVRTVFALVALLVMISLGRLMWHNLGPRSPEIVPEAKLAEHRPSEQLADGYVSSSECQSCHPRNFQTWHSSYHRTMTQIASPETIHGDFSVAAMNFEGRYYELQRRSDQFWVVMDDPDLPLDPNDPLATRIERPIALVTGSHHMQLYWYPVGQSRVLGLVPVHYLKDENQWLPASATLLRPHAEFSSDTGRWNVRCIQCHTTHGRTRPDEIGTDSQVVEFGISCEACHGPGKEHVELRRALSPSDVVDDNKILNPSHVDAKTASHICGLCHSYTMAKNLQTEQEEQKKGFRFRPGQKLTDSLTLVRKDDATRAHLQTMGVQSEKHFDERFWSDGMVRVAGREFNGMIGSGCYERGELSCMSCHSMHQASDDTRSPKEWANQQLKYPADSDDACLQCHSRESYGSSRHTHHADESHGSRCVNCHMPFTTYGLLRALRSHQIESPRVATSLATGRPNGCNLCHLDKSLGWTAQQLSDWFSQPVPDLTADDREISAALRWAMSGDAGQRAVVGWNMGWAPAQAASGTDWLPPALSQLMQDNYDVIRKIGYKSLQSIPEYSDIRFNFVAPQAERNVVTKEIMARWYSQPIATRPMVLLNDDGTLDKSRFDQLILRRDRRSVVLLE